MSLLVHFLTLLVKIWSDWGFQITVLSSLAAYLVQGLLSGTRRRSVSGWWRSILNLVGTLVLLVAYKGGDTVAKSALGKLSLCSSDATQDEQEVVAFWGPFLLLHLGGPDNMAAYSIEDSKLSLRKVVDLVVQFGGVLYLISNTFPCRGVLFAASALMFLVGAARYLESTYALWRADLESIKKEWKRKKKQQEEEDQQQLAASAATRIRQSQQQAHQDCLGNVQALLLAHDRLLDLLRAFADSSVVESETEAETPPAPTTIFLMGWRSICKLLVMELSLMYEVLYTKAMVAHTCTGYLIRFVSPLATAAAASLFWRWLRLRDGCLDVGGSYIVITYLLLAAAFFLDVVWLLRALGSTWTYHFFMSRTSSWPWLHHHVLCSGRWHSLHRLVVYLHPLRIFFGTDPISYRRWSGVVGRYNLLRECTATTTRRHPAASSSSSSSPFCRRLEETRYLSQLPPDAKELLFERVQQILPTPNNPPPDRPGVATYYMEAITNKWGHQALDKDKALVFPGIPDDELPKFGKEFEQDILVWHIATCIFLSRKPVMELAAAAAKCSSSSSRREQIRSSLRLVAAIKAMSEYLMFLVARRREMLPGLVLDTLLEATHGALVELWNDEDKRDAVCSQGRRNEEKLAKILVKQGASNDQHRDSREHKGKQLVMDAAFIAGALRNSSLKRRQLPPMLGEFIFKVWVDKLLYASVRCSTENHARQLSRGGELTTIFWLLVQHAGPFRIGEKKPPGKPKKNGDDPKPPPCPYTHPLPCPCPCPCPQDQPPWMLPPKTAMHESKEDEEPKEAEHDEGDEEHMDAEEDYMPIKYITLY
ncbi:hypothetical protein BS78_07G043900 [Paspalum vaginatum]|nr:hypothetical protein BS78_07G043900 [Paspalum vaginatum]KAJ1267267.1 hypothetical protein BS78_07G043900 [Paspalum vaginatum]